MRLFLLCLCMVLAGNCRTAQAQEQPGRGLFQAAGCMSCHRVGAVGGTSAPDLTFVGFRRSKEWLNVWLENPRAWKKDALMPDFRLSPKAREALVDYLSSLKGGGQSWNSLDGRVIYNRAGCVACHGRKGVGGEPNNNVVGGKIPALNRVFETYTQDELKVKIRRGVKPEKADPQGSEPLVSMPAWGEVLKDEEIDAVAVYLFSLGFGSEKESGW